ncbi:MAG: hypothetical protein PHV02_00775 [Rhodocyclaceae bacterium]|nr:hypothetical protein [Rhodocyclaceae bacterium]
MARSQPASVSEIESFVTLLRVACENPAIHATLTKLLTQPNDQRQGMIHFLVQEMNSKGAPVELIAAIECLQDDALAKKASKIISRSPPKRGFFDFLRS